MKMYKLEKKEKYICYLRELITRTFKGLERHSQYLEELNNYILIKNNNNEKIINYSDYGRFIDLLSSRESYLLNLIGDSQKVSMSYKKFRDLIEKRNKNGILGFELETLNEKDKTILSALNKLRNWINHVPESLLTSEEKLISEGVYKKHTINPLYFNDFESCTLKLIEDLYNQSNNLNHSFTHMFSLMKTYYSRMVGENITFEKRKIFIPRGVEILQIGEMSSDIQGLI